MQNVALNLNQLLRYGLAGAVFLILVVAAYQEPQETIFNEPSKGIMATGFFAVSLTAGSVLYSLHRAFPYHLLYWLFARLSRRKGPLIDLDIKRWQNKSKSGALQPHMDEWGAQIHFLYCVSWAGFAAIALGMSASWRPTSGRMPVFWATLCLFLAAMYSHYRYQKWEKRIFIEDDMDGNRQCSSC